MQNYEKFLNAGHGDGHFSRVGKAKRRTAGQGRGAGFQPARFGEVKLIGG